MSSSSSKDRERDRPGALGAPFTPLETVSITLADAIMAVEQMEVQNIVDFLQQRNNWKLSNDGGPPAMITPRYECVLPLWMGSPASTERRIAKLVNERIFPKIQLVVHVGRIDDNVPGYHVCVSAFIRRAEKKNEDGAAIDEDIGDQLAFQPVAPLVMMKK